MSHCQLSSTATLMLFCSDDPVLLGKKAAAKKIKKKGTAKNYAQSTANICGKECIT